MRKVIATLFAAALIAAGIAGASHAAAPAKAGSGMSLDGTLNFATEPASGFDSGWGFDLGFNVDLKRLGASVSTTKGTELQGRVSLGYYKWDDSFFGVDVEYRRIPLFVGGRVLYSASPAVKLYGQLGLELSFDKVELVDPFFFGKISETDTNIGITPGVGVLFPLSDQFYLGGALAWHIISDDYFTIGLTAGFNLP